LAAEAAQGQRGCIRLLLKRVCFSVDGASSATQPPSMKLPSMRSSIFVRSRMCVCVCVCVFVYVCVCVCTPHTHIHTYL
jgi:hypothetical protein